MMSVNDVGACEFSLPSVWVPLKKYLTLHPKYHEVFKETVNQLLYGVGPMKATDRHYVALMAASRHHCHFLMNLHAREFERLGGDLTWLKGIGHAPLKIQSLDKLNAILAHQPWNTSPGRIAALTKCPPPNNWLLSELVQAVIVLAHTHVLCSFVLGNDCIDPLENQRKGEWPYNENGWSSATLTTGGNDEIKSLLLKMRELAANNKKNDVIRSSNFANVEEYVINADDDRMNITSDNDSSGQSAVECVDSQSVPQFTFDNTYAYEDFINHSKPKTVKTLKIHDFSWEDHGYSCVFDLYSEIADMLDKKFTLTQNLTYFTLGGYSDVDTTKYRTAVWMYIQCLFGIRHDDYDYAEVNLMLSREMKTFLKTVCCFPNKVTSAMRKSFMPGFEPSEKVHVLLMIMEARLQAELIYFFRAFLELNTALSCS
ncbi:hypothetical protein AB6A40_001968 [Gnathostoma spinigerum]|uniref:Sestrin n=1 Tax=Gnathostoma spinigerum TaxID=75299 RepID=A0ABD6ED52_9BILA